MILPGCGERGSSKESGELEKGKFGYDLEFLQKHQDVIVLKADSDSDQIIICPQYQGRIMTSTSSGVKGSSYGWINYDLISSNKTNEHINVYGGEDRFWLGPEGGQYSIFFDEGSPFDFDFWQTPALIDTEPFNVVEKGEKHAVFSINATLTNYQGSVFDLEIKRRVVIHTPEEINEITGIDIGPEVETVGFSSINELRNSGDSSWNRESGMLSIWILGMLNPSDETVVVIPFKEGDAAKLGQVVTDEYFGEISEDRLKIEQGLIYFKADGSSRGKIGVSQKRAKQFAGSYDPENKVLTIIKYSLPKGSKPYVNSLWKYQEEPFHGDVVNSYNDGPLEDGSQLGPFYELESSSPAAELEPSGSITHHHTTLHFHGDQEQLDLISAQLLGATTRQISEALK